MSGEDENEDGTTIPEMLPSMPPSEEGPLDPVEEAYGRSAHGGRRKSRRQRRRIPGESISHLNLTPMMDIMTMLLVFLVKSFATAPENINVNLSLRPPQSTTQVEMRAATKVTVTKEEILVDDTSIMPVSQVTANTSQAAIPVLRDALLERAEHLKALENRGGPPFDGRLLVVADETTPYSLVTSVLLTAGESKFSEYKLVVMQKGSATE